MPIAINDNSSAYLRKTPNTVTNQPVAAQQQTDATKARIASQSNQVTSFTWIQKTQGYGAATFTVTFGCTFSTEPVVQYASAFVSGDDGTAVPVSQVVVRRWLIDASGQFTGAECYVVVYQPTAASNDDGGYSS